MAARPCTGRDMTSAGAETVSDQEPLLATTLQQKARRISPSKSRTQSAISSVFHCNTMSILAPGRTKEHSTSSTCSRLFLSMSMTTGTSSPAPFCQSSGTQARQFRPCQSGLLQYLSLRSLPQSRCKRVALGRRPCRAASNDQQRYSRLKRLGRRSERGDSLFGRPMGRWRAAQ